MAPGANIASDGIRSFPTGQGSLPTDGEHVFMGSDASQGTDWAVLVQRIRERMYLSQVDIAARCGVARQSVSAWLHHRRAPGLYAKRALLLLAAEAGVLDEGEAPRDGYPARREGEPDALQLQVLMDQLSAEARREVLEFARFKILRERA